MKRILILLVIAVVGFSCEKESFKSFLDTDKATPLVMDSATNKKGVAFTYNNETWSTRISRLNAHWHYSWGFRLQPTRPTGVEYVPMFWGKWAPNDENIAYIDSLALSGDINYLLGFNEPDKDDQSNISVEEVVELWPRLEQTGLPLISPAPVNPDNKWMTDFMRQVEEKGLRVDYVAIHWYGGANAMAFLNMVKKVYSLYNRPIWITEFAVADWGAATLEDNRYSKEEVLAFMQEVLPALDKLPFVHRYAWYNGSPNGRVLGNSVLFDANDELTELGQFYANHTPNLNAGPGDDSWYSGIDSDNGDGDGDGDGDDENKGDPVYSSEAEDGDLTNAGGDAVAGGCANKSGSGLIFMRGTEEGQGDHELKFSPVNVEAEGTYDLEITYFAKVETQLEISINGSESIVESGFDAPGFCFETQSATISIEINLEAGDNEIVFSPVEGQQSPYLDKIAIYNN